MLGIFLGIAAVVSLISLGQGLQTAITGQFATLDADKLIIENSGTGFGPPGSTAVEKLNSKDLELLKSVSGVEFAIPRLIRVVTIEFNKISNFRFITSVPSDSDELDVFNDILNVDPELGRLLESSDKGKVVLGNDYLDNSFEKSIRIGSQIKIQGKDFEVIGILERSSTFTINSMILMPESDLKEILNIDDEIDAIVIQVVSKEDIEFIASNIERKLRDDRNLKLGEEDFSVQTPLQSLGAINTVLNIINLIVSGIAAISLLVGGIGIANTMYTSVLERTKEIGIMKSIGAKNSDILYIFLIESALLGLVGGIVGIALGFSISKTIEFIAVNQLGTTLLRASTPVALVIGSLIFAILSGAISGSFPAYRASKTIPVEALRYE
jgi:putative ABC transport system permease protein